MAKGKRRAEKKPDDTAQDKVISQDETKENKPAPNKGSQNKPQSVLQRLLSPAQHRAPLGESNMLIPEAVDSDPASSDNAKFKRGVAETKEQKMCPDMGEHPELKITPGRDPRAPAAKDTPSTDPQAPAAKNTPSTDPRVPAAKNTPGTDPRAPAAKNTPSTDPRAPAAKNTPSIDPRAPAAKNTPSIDPRAPAAKNTPGTDPQVPAAKNTPGTDPQVPAAKNTPGTDPRAPAAKNTPGTDSRGPASKNRCRAAHKKTENKAPQNKKVTDYYPIRRSNRKTKAELKSEEHRHLDDLIKNGVEEGMEVKHIEGKGRGVFAVNGFKKGDFVVEYSGDLLELSEAKVREAQYSQDPSTGCYMYYFQYQTKTYCVDATKESKRLGRLLNHSKNGNCQTRLHPIDGTPHLILVASRDIEADEELLYDYGDRSREAISAHPWLKY